MSDNLALADRLAGMASGDAALDEEAALALGYHVRKVTSLGLNGRTPGRWLWFPPCPYPHTCRGAAKPPRLTGPRNIAKTIAALRAHPLKDGGTSG